MKEPQPHTGPAERLETLVIRVSGMTCEHCSRRVDQALRGRPGVRDVRVDRVAGTATVTFAAGQMAIAELRSVVVKSGYQVPGTA